MPAAIWYCYLPLLLLLLRLVLLVLLLLLLLLTASVLGLVAPATTAHNNKKRTPSGLARLLRLKVHPTCRGARQVPLDKINPAEQWALPLRVDLV